MTGSDDGKQLLLVSGRVGIGTMRLYAEGFPEALGAISLRVPIRLLQPGETASPPAELHLCLPAEAAEQILDQLPAVLDRLRRNAARQDH
ncbi:MAG: hypothetical protein OXI11_12925 [Gammaproteobacteria bacterium]|nr:hypothetical protein [Gammaproteobacteria bacterium]